MFEILAENMKIYYEMGLLIFNHLDDEKFIYNDFKSMYQLNPKKNTKMKEYIMIKDIINKARTEDGKRV